MTAHTTETLARFAKNRAMQINNEIRDLTQKIAELRAEQMTHSSYADHLSDMITPPSKPIAQPPFRPAPMPEPMPSGIVQPNGKPI